MRLDAGNVVKVDLYGKSQPTLKECSKQNAVIVDTFQPSNLLIVLMFKLMI
jgi:hypothetical protein